MTFKVGSRVRCIDEFNSQNLLVEDGTYTIAAVFGDEKLRLDNTDGVWRADRFEPSAPITPRPCFVCGTPTPGEVCGLHAAARQYEPINPLHRTAPVACVPDDVQPESYDARRQRIAAERNPGAWHWVTTGEPWPDDKQQAQGEGIRRAVDNLNQHENRLGAARWEP